MSESLKIIQNLITKLKSLVSFAEVAQPSAFEDFKIFEDQL